MELTIKEQPLEYLQRKGPETVYQEQTAEISVPETLPDIDRIVDCYGTVIVQEKRCEDGVMQLSGGIQAGVLYVPVGEGPVQTLEAWVPFLIKKPVQAQDACLIAQPFLKSMDARTVQPRKAIVRANLGAELTLLTPETFALASIEDPPDILQQQQSKYPVLLPVACGEQDFRVQDELTLPDTVPAIDRILRWELDPEVEESRMIGSKALFRGKVLVRVLYLGVDGSLNTYVGALPFSQYAELPGEWPDSTVTVFPVVTAAQLESDGSAESRTLLADLNVLAQVCVVDQRLLALTEDAYVVGGTLEPVWQEVALHPQLDRMTLSQNAVITVPVKASQVVQAAISPDHPTQRRTAEQLALGSSLNGSLLYFDTDGLLRGKSLRGDCAVSVQMDGSPRCDCTCALSGTPEVRVLPDSVQITAPLTFTLALCQEEAWKNLAGGTITKAERAKRPSVIVRRFPGGALWPLAKQLGAAVADIRAANNLPDNTAPDNEILLIPMR